MEFRHIGLLIIAFASVNAVSTPSEVESLQSLIVALQSAIAQLESDFYNIQIQFSVRLSQLFSQGQLPGLDTCNRDLWFHEVHKVTIPDVESKQKQVKDTIFDTFHQVQEKNALVDKLILAERQVRDNITILQPKVTDFRKDVDEQNITVTKLKREMETMTGVLSTTECVDSLPVTDP